MEHQSLYRKYRSQSFEEVVGQTHVTHTLQNAISSGRVAHAYLFCGPRGTGKTSTARLLAKALNCERGPTPTPCNECDLCRGITAGRAMDVVEVDAASETGIDNVREVIINNSRYAPAQGRYKIYIIDEVHDLSRPAFDGLLKTLEEPPAHVVFVLATTEIHKVPATIISRCQRFEFRRGSLEEVRSRVEYVAQQEGVELEPAAASLIARSASGGWRDALSLLQQVISFCDKKVTAKDVGVVLGAIEDESLANLTQLALAHDGLGAVQALDNLLSQGKDIRQLLHNFADYLRDCVLHAMGAPSDGTRPLTRLQTSQGMRLLEETSRAERELRWNTQHRLVIELMLLRMASPEPAVQTAALPATASQPVAPPPTARPYEPAPAPTARPYEPAPAPTARPYEPAPAAAARSYEPAPEGPRSAPARATGGIGYRQAPGGAPPAPSSPASASPVPTSPAPPPQPAAPPVSQPPTASAPANGASTELPAAPGQDWGAGTPPAAGDSLYGGGSDLDIAAIAGRWKQVISLVNSSKRTLAATLRDASLGDYSGGQLTLQFKRRYHYETVEEPTARREVEDALGRVMGQPIRILCRLSPEAEAAPRPRATRKEVQPVTDADLVQLFPGWEIQDK